MDHFSVKDVFIENRVDHIVIMHTKLKSRCFDPTPTPFYQRFLLLLLLTHIVQELCESRGGRPGLSVLTSLLVSVDVKLY